MFHRQGNLAEINRAQIPAPWLPWLSKHPAMTIQTWGCEPQLLGIVDQNQPAPPYAPVRATLPRNKTLSFDVELLTKVCSSFTISSHDLPSIHMVWPWSYHRLPWKCLVEESPSKELPWGVLPLGDMTLQALANHGGQGSKRKIEHLLLRRNLSLMVGRW